MTLPISERLKRQKRRQEGFKLHEIEGNPLTPEEKEMFEMFDREGWDDERRRAYIIGQFVRPDTL